MLRATRIKCDPDKALAEAFQIASRIALATKPRSIYLFGSVAEGSSTDQSDFDFLVVVRNTKDIRTAQKNLLPSRPLSKKPIDIIWMSESEFESKSQIGGIAFIAREDGKLLYHEGELK